MTVGWRILAVAIVIFALPPVVLASDVGDIIAPPQTINVSVSPLGTKVAIVKHVEGHAQVALLDVGTGIQTTVFDGSALLKGQESWLLSLQWVDDQRAVVIVTERREAVAQLLDTRQSTSAYVIDLTAGVEETLYPVETSGVLVDPLPDSAGMMLYGKSGRTSRLFRIDTRRLNGLNVEKTRRTLIDGGQFNRTNEVARYESGYVLRWFMSDSNGVRSVLAVKPPGELVLDRYDETSEEWSNLKVWSFESDSDDSAAEEEDQSAETDESVVIPLAAAEAANEYFAVIEEPGQSDGVYRYNVLTGQKTLIYRHLSADVHRVMIDKKTRTLRGVGIVDKGELRFEYFDNALSAAVSAAKAAYPDHRAAVIDNDIAGRWQVVSVWSFFDPGRYLLWDSEAASLDEIASRKPGYEVNQRATLVTGEATSAGLAIPYLLALPSTNGDPKPLVVLPHGGPIGVVDERSYDPLAQFLLSEGFAVLQVNYRGSAGFSDEFLEAGKREFGGKILDDIMAAFDLVSQRADVSASRACIAGGSYGGYAALALGARYPDRFQCAASVAGVTDINLALADTGTDADVREWQREFIGDPAEDFDELAQISPAYMASDFRIPVFLAHGTDDQTVDIEHAYRMKYGLDQASKSVEFHVLEDAGHNINDPEVAVELYQLLASFLHSSLDR